MQENQDHKERFQMSKTRLCKFDNLFRFDFISKLQTDKISNKAILINLNLKKSICSFTNLHSTVQHSNFNTSVRAHWWKTNPSSTHNSISGDSGNSCNSTNIISGDQSNSNADSTFQINYTNRFKTEVTLLCMAF